MNSDFYYDDPNKKDDENKNAGKIGVSLASFLLGIFNMCCCLCSYSPVLSTLSLVFGILALMTHRGAKGYAITGIVVSSVALVLWGSTFLMFGKFYPDMRYFLLHADEIVEQYDKDGSMPERFEKYHDEKYQKYWYIFDCDDFDELYGKIIKSYKEAMNKENGTSTEKTPRNEDSSAPDKKYDDDGESLIDLSARVLSPV